MTRPTQERIIPPLLLLFAIGVSSCKKAETAADHGLQGSSWAVFEDAAIKFEYPKELKISRMPDYWMASEMREGGPVLRGSLFVFVKDEARNLETIYKEARAGASGRFMSKPIKRRIEASDCIVYYTEEAMSADCYDRSSRYFHAVGSYFPEDFQNATKKQTLQGDFEKFLRSIKIKKIS